jgi:hypothetical protein
MHSLLGSELPFFSLSTKADAKSRKESNACITSSCTSSMHIIQILRTQLMHSTAQGKQATRQSNHTFSTKSHTHACTCCKVAAGSQIRSPPCSAALGALQDSRVRQQPHPTTISNDSEQQAIVCIQECTSSHMSQSTTTVCPTSSSIFSSTGKTSI